MHIYNLGFLTGHCREILLVFLSSRYLLSLSCLVAMASLDGERTSLSLTRKSLLFSSIPLHPKKGGRMGKKETGKTKEGEEEEEEEREQPTTIQLRKPSCPPPLFFYSLYFPPPFATLFPFIPVPSAKPLRTSSKEFSPSLSPPFPFHPPREN